jgi:hypothetical protein
VNWQINNAGDGGLYPEMVRDRSFDAAYHRSRLVIESQAQFAAPLHNGSMERDAAAWHSSLALKYKPRCFHVHGATQG